MNSQLHNQNKPFTGATLRKESVDKPPVNGSFIMETQEEIWKDIIGYEGCYQVSNFGNIKSLDRVVICKNGKQKTLFGQIIISRKNNSGYYLSMLCKNGKRKNCLVNRLVAIHFIPNPHNKPEVNHKDTIKTNNVVENLEWVTRCEQMNHAAKNGKLGKMSPEARERVNNINRLRGISCAKHLAIYNGVEIREVICTDKNGIEYRFKSFRSMAKELKIDRHNASKYCNTGEIYSGYTIKFSAESLGVVLPIPGEQLDLVLG